MNLKKLNRQELTETVNRLQNQNNALLQLINMYIEFNGNKDEFSEFLKKRAAKNEKNKKQEVTKEEKSI